MTLPTRAAVVLVYGILLLSAYALSVDDACGGDVSLELALRLFDHGDQQGSAACLRAVHERSGNVTERLLAARALTGLYTYVGDHRAALGFVERVLALQPEDLDAYIRKSAGLQALSEFEASALTLDKGIRVARRVMLNKLCGAIGRSSDGVDVALLRTQCLRMQKDRQILYYWKNASREFTGQDDGDVHVLHLFHHFSPSPEKIIFDIGANKGFFLEELYTLWGLLPLQRFVNKHGVRTLRKALQPTALNPPSSASPTVHAFEPNPGTFELLKKIVQGDYPQHRLHLHQIALSNVTGVSPLFAGDYADDEEVGSEYTTLLSAGHRVADVETMTFDAFVDRAQISGNFDLVKVDVEGFEDLVLQGMQRALQEHRIRLLLFEFNGAWKKIGARLLDRITWLDSLGYDSFMVGNRNLIQVNGFWDDIYNYDVWQSVLSVPRDHELRYSFIEKFNLDLQTCILTCHE